MRSAASGLLFDNLPPRLQGAQDRALSDIHSGSFHNKKAVEKGIDKVRMSGRTDPLHR